MQPEATQLQQDKQHPLTLHSTTVDVMHTSECRILSYHTPSIWDVVLNVDGTQHQASEGHEWRTARHPVSRTGLLKWHSRSCDKHVTQYNAQCVSSRCLNNEIFMWKNNNSGLADEAEQIPYCATSHRAGPYTRSARLFMGQRFTDDLQPSFCLFHLYISCPLLSLIV